MLNLNLQSKQASQPQPQTQPQTQTQATQQRPSETLQRQLARSLDLARMVSSKHQPAAGKFST